MEGFPVVRRDPNAHPDLRSAHEISARVADDLFLFLRAETKPSPSPRVDMRPTSSRNTFDGDSILSSRFAAVTVSRATLWIAATTSDLPERIPSPIRASHCTRSRAWRPVGSRCAARPDACGCLLCIPGHIGFCHADADARGDVLPNRLRPVRGRVAVKCSRSTQCALHVVCNRRRVGSPAVGFETLRDPARDVVPHAGYLSDASSSLRYGSSSVIPSALSISPVCIAAMMAAMSVAILDRSSSSRSASMV